MPLSAIYSPILQPNSPTVAKERGIRLVYIISKQLDNGCEEQIRLPVLRNLSGRLSRWGPLRKHSLAVSTIGQLLAATDLIHLKTQDLFANERTTSLPYNIKLERLPNQQERYNWGRWISPRDTKFSGKTGLLFLLWTLFIRGGTRLGHTRPFFLPFYDWLRTKIYTCELAVLGLLTIRGLMELLMFPISII